MDTKIPLNYKLSQYNIFHQNTDILYVWNTYSGALLELDKKSQLYMKNFSGFNDGSDEFNLLNKQGFIVYDKLDEFGRIWIADKQALFNPNPSELRYVIAVGMGCNYSCDYCFQRISNKVHEKNVMTSEIAKDVAEFICQELNQTPSVKSLNISWFGGEPLLYVDIIEIISRRLIEHTKNKGIKYSAGIMTNGRFLDAPTVELLTELCVERAQITVDGLKDVYCISKGATPEDFEAVINNICSASEKIRLSLRLNIPDNNADNAIAITNYLLSKCNSMVKPNIYFAFVRDYLLSQEQLKSKYKVYVQNYFKWLNRLLEDGNLDQISPIFPKRKKTSCCLISEKNACIGTSGELYRCEHRFGDCSMIMGNIYQGRFFNENEKETTMYYTKQSKYLVSQCKDCAYVPICMGGCPDNILQGFTAEDCEAFKEMQLRLKLIEGGVSMKLLLNATTEGYDEIQGCSDDCIYCDDCSDCMCHQYHGVPY